MYYYSLNEYLKNTFGEKVYKISLDGGMTCPNRDGKIDTRGCIFCSRGGSGEFSADRNHSITEQIWEAKERIGRKTDCKKFIAYFQPFTNTYAPVEYLEKIFTEAIEPDEIVALSVATRPDCLPDKTVNLLSRLNKIKPVWVELGLQTVHKSTADYIRRGYDLSVYDDAVKRLHKEGISVITHIIIGLPNETEDMIELHPGETAVVTDNQEIDVVTANVQEAISWKDDMFVFRSSTLEQIMEEAARWYDIRIVWVSEERRHTLFSGELPRSKDFIDFVRMIELTEKVSFSVKGRTVYID